MGAIGSLCAAVLQYRDTAPFEYHFTESSWKPYGPEEFYLEIGRSEHGKGRSPEAALYQKNAATGVYSVVEPDFMIEPSGTVYIVVGKRSRISGKVVIR